MNDSKGSYDLVVIGGGPAGSCAATLARKKGLSVLVIEREKFPRFRIGESLLPMGNALLQEMGVWGKVQKGGFFPKYGASFYLANGGAEKHVSFEDGYVSGLEMTYQVERARFDALLLEHAAEQGAEVQHQRVVTKVEQTAHVCTVWTTDTISGAEQPVHAKWVIDAGGREQRYSSKLKAELDPAIWPKRVAVYAHFRGVRRDPGKREGNTVIVRLPSGWFWLIPLDDEITSVGMVLTTDELRQSDGKPEDVFWKVVKSSSCLMDRMRDASAETEFHVTSDYSYFRQRLAEGRVILTGDAAGFFDPIFSSGVYVAMESAKQAVELVVSYFDEPGLPEKVCKLYTAKMKKHAGVFRKLIDVFYDNDAFAVFLCPTPPMDLGRGINSIVAGHAKLTWPLWWRFEVFLKVCKWQRQYQLVEPIEWEAVN